MQPALDAIDNDNYTDVATRYFAEKLLAADTPCAKAVCRGMFLKQFYNDRSRMDVPLDATRGHVKEVAANWLEHYKLHLQQYEPVFLQEALGRRGRHAIRLYGRAAGDVSFWQTRHLRTREPVSEKIWNALLVSAPLMLMSEVLIYLIAVPLGIFCGVYRGSWIDQGISLGLFVLYSIPGFIAACCFWCFSATATI